MEKDIKLLEDLFYEDESYEPNGYVEIFLHKEQQQAIKNLIKGYKLEKLKNTIYEQSLQEALKDYIPKSKIEEVIKKVNESNGFSPVNKILIEQVLNSILY